jgi:hypothetical protein
MPQTTTAPPAGQRLFLVGAALAAVALLMGLWDLLVEQDGGSWIWQAVLPAALLALMLTLARRPDR